MEKPFLKRKSYFMTLEDNVMRLHEIDREHIIWIDSKGTEHAIKYMDNNYIKNCINKIERGEFDFEKTEKLSTLKNELIYREILKNYKKELNTKS